MNLEDILICFGWVAVIWFIIRFVQVAHEPEYADSDGWIDAEDAMPRVGALVEGIERKGIIEYAYGKVRFDGKNWVDEFGGWIIGGITHWRKLEDGK